jgi:hypothetical protein
VTKTRSLRIVVVEDAADALGAGVRPEQPASSVWEPKFVGAIMRGEDPRRTPRAMEPSAGVTVADLLERYQTRYVEAEGLRSADTIKGHVKTLKTALGDRPVTVLEKPADISRSRPRFGKGTRSRP